MATRSSRTVALVSAVTLGALLLAGSPSRAAAQCAYPDVKSGGIWVYLLDSGSFTITLVNLTDYLLYDSGEVMADHPSYPRSFHAPLANDWNPVHPLRVADLDGDGVLEEGVPPYSSVVWKSEPAPLTPQHYQGPLALELRGFTAGSGVVHPGPAWPSKFWVFFTPQAAAGGRLGQGTWVALRPDDYAAWEGRNLFRSGVWTTPHFPANVSLPPAPDDFEMRNIMTIANKWVVATLYGADNECKVGVPCHRNVVVVVRQTNWVDAPTAGMDSYLANRLDWAEDPDSAHNSVPGSCNR